jgi:transcriptional regulator with XRE-family HTH domain
MKQAPLPTVRELGIRLKELREREKLTVHDIARRAKMRDQDVVQFERDGRIEGEHLVALIATVSADRSFEGAFKEMAVEKIDLETLPGILDAWSAGHIESREAIRRARLEDYADLLQTAIDNEVRLPSKPTPIERENAQRFAGMEF